MAAAPEGSFSLSQARALVDDLVRLRVIVINGLHGLADAGRSIPEEFFRPVRGDPAFVRTAEQIAYVIFLGAIQLAFAQVFRVGLCV